jgi:hypothetical protein
MRDCKFEADGLELPLGRDSTQCRVSLVQHYELPPCSRQVVVAKVDDPEWAQGHQEVMFEPSKKQLGLFLGRTVGKIANNRIVLPVINTTREAVELDLGTVVGNVTTFEETEDSCLGKPQANDAGKPGSKVNLDETDLDDSQKAQVRDLVNEFEDVVATDLSQLKTTTLVKHVIETKPGEGPVRSKPYHVPYGLRSEVKQQIKEMLNAGLISPSSAEWCSPIVLVKKKDGSWRFCVDYRKLNSITVPQAFPMTSIDNVVELMKGNTIFSCLDLFSGFYQVAMEENSKEKSTFITSEGCYKFNVMSMGLMNSPFTMQRLAMALNLDLITSGCSIPYIDDWVFMSPCFEHHMDLMRLVFQRMREARLSVKLSKCQLFQKKVEYLGHVLTAEGLAVANHHIQAMINFKSPTSKKEIRRLNGLFGYYRRFVPRYAEIIKPILRLTKKDVEFDWDDDCEKAKNELIQHLTTAPILAFPDFSAPFRLATDASAIAVAGVLSQLQKDGTEHPISYFSKALNKAESRYPAVEQELMAIVLSIKHFAKFLYGHQFTVFTDNVSCVAILKKPNLSPRLARWALAVQEHQFDVQYKAGRLNVVADALSRQAPVAAIDTNDEADIEQLLKEFPTGATAHEFSAAQKSDYRLGPIMLYLAKAKYPQDSTKAEQSKIRSQARLFELIDDVAFRILDTGQRVPAVPARMRRDLLFAYHTSLFGMHQGVAKTIEKLRARYWWPQLRATVKDYIAHCLICQQAKDPIPPIRLPFKFQYAQGPWDILAIDFQGPFPRSKSGNRNILVFTDFFTKWVEIQATPDQLATTVAKVYVERVICRFGASRVLLSDRAQNFLSEVVAEVNKLFQVEHRKTTAYRPQTNGLVEVTNRTIKHMIASFVDESQTEWDRHLDLVQMCHNSSRHTIINSTPSMLLFGREMRLPVELLIPQSPGPIIEEGEFVKNLRERLSQVWQLARENIDQGRLKQAARRAKEVHSFDLKVGDAVLFRDKHCPVGRSRKLVPRWTGPWTILRTTDTNVQIQLISMPDSRTKWVHKEHVKPYLDDFVRGSDVLAGTLLLDGFESDSSLSSRAESSDEDGPDDLPEQNVDEGNPQQPGQTPESAIEQGVSVEAKQESEPGLVEQSKPESNEASGSAGQEEIDPKVGVRNTQDAPVPAPRRSQRLKKTTRRSDFVYSS